VNASRGVPGINWPEVTVQIGSLASNDTAALSVVLRFTDTTTAIVTNQVLATSSTPELFPEDNRVLTPFRVSADNDHDGLADDWEVEFFGSLSGPNGGPGEDYDGDGRTNLQEFLSGTNPADSANDLRIRAVSLQGGEARVRFHAVTGIRYQLLRASFVNGAWIPVGNPVIGDGRSMTVADRMGPASRFYRLRAGE
jgi:hypothetical protein